MQSFYKKSGISSPGKKGKFFSNSPIQKKRALKKSSGSGVILILILRRMSSRWNISTELKELMSFLRARDLWRAQKGK
jgi:hypothetical protein